MLLQVERKGPFAPLKTPVIHFYSGFIEDLTRLLPRARSGTKRTVEVRCTCGRIKKIGLPNLQQKASALQNESLLPRTR